MLEPPSRSGGYMFNTAGTSLERFGPRLPIKLTPFEEAAATANRGCGGDLNRDPPPRRPAVAYVPGAEINVTWALAIKHPSAYTNSGVRLALHFADGDSFQHNVLAGGLSPSPPFTPLSAAPSEADGNTGRALVRIPAGKTCDHCVLQFVWAAAPGTDGPTGGYYVSCADVSAAQGLLTADSNPMSTRMHVCPARACIRRQVAITASGALPHSVHDTKIRHLLISIVGSLIVFIVASCFARYLRGRWDEEEAQALRRERESRADMRTMDLTIDAFEMSARRPNSTTRC